MKMKYVVPYCNKRSLLYIATLVWAFAGGMLIFRFISGVQLYPQWILFKLILGISCGLLFYVALFNKISRKHTLRIASYDNEKRPFYDFFDKRGYIMMLSMISLGLSLRVFNVVPFEYLSIFYLIMGIPLLISSMKFLRMAISL